MGGTRLTRAQEGGEGGKGGVRESLLEKDGVTVGRDARWATVECGGGGLAADLDRVREQAQRGGVTPGFCCRESPQGPHI